MPKPRLPSRLVLLGSDVGASLSPVFQRAAIAAAGLTISYDAVNVSSEMLTETVAEIRRDNIAGNVTRPHKKRFHDACDVLTPIAKRVGAVNTFWMDDGRLHGDNTDAQGFEAAARELLDHRVENLAVLLLGAGGAAAAVLAAVEGWPGSRAVVIGRDKSKAALLAERYRDFASAASDTTAAARSAGFIVNATPVGQYDDSYPLPVALIPRETAVMDLVYRRGQTPWVRALRANGNAARDGTSMLLEQGALSFRQWFGIEPDRQAMRRSLEAD